jgi:PAS domain S-box-containing protein
VAIEAIKSGATDCVLKHRLERLVPAVRRAIQEAEEQRERKRAEEALRRSEEQFRTLVERGPAATYIRQVAEHGSSTLYVSPQIESQTGYPPRSFVRNPELWIKLLHPEDRERVLAEDRRTEETGEPFSIEYRQITRDGRVVWIRDEAVLVRDEERRSLVRQGMMCDITERKEAEEALSRSAILYRSAVEQATENICFVDVETGRIVEANATLSRWLGYDPEELKRMRFHDIVAHDRESLDGNVERVVAGETHHLGEQHYRRKDGSLVHVEVSVNVVPYDDKEAMCIVAHDVTERRRAEENLRHSLSVLLALREAGQVLGSTLSSEEIISRLLEIMRGVSHLTAALISMQDKGGQLRVWRSAGLEGLRSQARFEQEAEVRGGPPGGPLPASQGQGTRHRGVGGLR